MDEPGHTKGAGSSAGEELDDIRFELKVVAKGNLSAERSLKNVNLALNSILRELDEIRSQLAYLRERTADVDQVNKLALRLERLEFESGLDQCELSWDAEPALSAPEVTEMPPEEQIPAPKPVPRTIYVIADAPPIQRVAAVSAPQSQTDHEAQLKPDQPTAAGPELPPHSDVGESVTPEPAKAGLDAMPAAEIGTASIGHEPSVEQNVTPQAESFAASVEDQKTATVAASVPIEPPVPRKEFNWAELESKAAVWGTRAGVLIVVLGLGYLLSIGFGKLGALGKACVVYMVSVGMLATGVVFEKLERYSTWAKIMIAGGWAAVYVTTFMIHYLPEARLIHSASFDMFLLAAVATGMIAHSFRYRSQSLTILTYFIAFATIILSIHFAGPNYFSLVATTTLALSMLVILHALQWHRLALFCLIACYGIHVLWAAPLIASFRLPGGHGTEFWAGLIIILLYWLIFTAAVYLTRPRDKEGEILSLTMTGLNFLFFVAVFRYHVGTGHPELAWLFTISLLAAYGALAYLAFTRAWLNLFRLLFVIAVICSTATLYLKLANMKLVAIGWLIQSEALYVAGLFRNERSARWLGIAGFILVGMWLLGMDCRTSDQVSLLGLSFFRRTAGLAATAGALYLNAVIRRSMGNRITEEDSYSYLFSYAASVLWLVLVFLNWFPQEALIGSVMTALLGLGLIEIGIRHRNPHFGVQGMFFSFLATGGALYPLQAAPNLYYDHGMLYRIFCEAVVIGAAYTGFVRLQKKGLWEDSLGDIRKVASIIAAVASAVCATLLYREFAPVAPVWLSLAWTVFGILLVEAGLSTRNSVFRTLGYSVKVLALGWTLYGFFGRPDWFQAPQLQTLSLTTVIAGFFYEFARLKGIAKTSPSELLGAERFEVFSGAGPLPSIASSVAATSILVLLLRQELIVARPIFITTAWVVAAVVLLEVGFYIRNQALRWEAVAVADLAFIYALLNSPDIGWFWGPIDERLIACVLDIFGLYYICERLFRLEKTEELSPQESYGAAQISWAAGILMVVLIKWELWPSAIPAWVGAAWAIPLLAFFFLSRTRLSMNYLAQWCVLAAVIFLWTALRTNPAAAPWKIASLIAPHRLFAVVPIIGIFYWIFWSTLKAPKVGGAQNRGLYESYGGEAVSWGASILLFALIAMEIGRISYPFVTIVWAALVIALSEISRVTRSRALKAQAYAFAAVISIRAILTYGYYATPRWTALSTAIVFATLLYLYFKARASKGSLYLSIQEELLAAPMIYLAAAMLLPALYFEVRPYPWVPVAWGTLLLFVIGLGTWVRDRSLINLSFLLVLPMIIGIWFLDLDYRASFPVFPAIGALFGARVVWEFGYRGLMEPLAQEQRRTGFSPPLELQRYIFSGPAAALLFIAIVIYFSGHLSKYLTLAWGCEGLLLTVMGFGLRDRKLRFLGLGLLGICVVKVFFDLYTFDIDRIFKVIALIGLGVILILTGWIYSRYREKITQFIMD